MAGDMTKMDEKLTEAAVDKKITVVLADDDVLAAKALVQIIESDGRFEVSAFGHSEDEAVSLYAKHKPDVLLLDIRMGEGSGIEAARRVLSVHEDAQVLFLSTFLDRDYLVQAVRIGAKGYILKQSYEALVPALISVANGQRVFAEAVAGELRHVLDGDEKKAFSKLERSGLNQREIEIVTLVAEGMNNKEIATKLYLSEGTVRNQISQILEKLELRDRTQLVVFYFRNDS